MRRPERRAPRAWPSGTCARRKPSTTQHLARNSIQLKPRNTSAITDDRPRPALRSTRNRPRKAVRRGASWTAAYRRQLTVAAVARPVRGGVGAPGVLAAERSWWLLAQTASARRSVQPVPRARAWSPWSTRPAGTPRRRSPVSSRRCPPIQSGVRDPAVQPSGVRSPGVVVQRVRRSDGCCPPVRCPAVRCPSVRCPAVWCLPSSVRTRPSPPTQAVAVGTRSRWPATVTTGTGGGPGGCRAVDGSIDGQRGRDAGDAADVALVTGGRWRTRAAGWVRAAAAAALDH